MSDADQEHWQDLHNLITMSNVCWDEHGEGAPDEHAERLHAFVDRVREPRRWLYGLTADEWLHLACEGDKSEIAPCCGNLGELRELLQELAMFQGPDDGGWVQSIGRRLLQALEADGDGHNLGNAEDYPLLHRVLAGLRRELPEEAKNHEVPGVREVPQGDVERGQVRGEEM